MNKISVIVCHHKGTFIHNFVESVKKSLYANFEIIVVTSDKSLGNIRGCRVIVTDEPLPASKRNIGADCANGEYLAFFDDDVEVDYRTLCNLQQCLDKTQAGMVYGKLYNMEHRRRLDEAGGFLTWTGFIWSRAEQNIVDEGQFDEVEYILAGKSASCMIRTEDFFACGRFDQDFGILGEETDLSWRVWLMGKKVAFCPQAIGYHAFNTKFKPAQDYYTSDRVHFNGCRNYITMLIKNLGGCNLWKIVPIHMMIWIVTGFTMIMSGRRAQGWNVLRGIGYVIRNLRMILEKRTKIQMLRKVNDKWLMEFVMRNPSRSYFTQRLKRYISLGLHG